MAKQTSKPGSFVGDYVADVTLACVAGIAASEHVMLLGAPGWGKTRVAVDVARAVAGSDHSAFLACDASTPPEEIKGWMDVQTWLKDGRYSIITQGTALDDNAHVIVADEFGRLNDVSFSPFLKALERQDIPRSKQPTFIGTSNFMLRTERLEAVVDRFAIWLHVKPENVSVREMAEAQMEAMDDDLHVAGLPSWDDIAAVRNAKPGPLAKNFVVEAICNLEAAANAELARLVKKRDNENSNRGGNSLLFLKGLTPEMLKVNPRRVRQWKNILFRYGMLVTGSDNFASLPSDVMRVLLWAFPLTTPAQAQDWQRIVSAVLDPIDTMIKNVKAETFEAFRNVMRKYDMSDPSSRAAAAQQLGVPLAKAQQNLSAFTTDADGKQNKRVADALTEMTNAFARACKGEDPG